MSWTFTEENASGCVIIVMYDAGVALGVISPDAGTGLQWIIWLYTYINIWCGGGFGGIKKNLTLALGGAIYEIILFYSVVCFSVSVSADGAYVYYITLNWTPR